MRTFLTIKLDEKSVRKAELRGEELARAGRHLIAKSLLESHVATVDPLGPENPLIFSVGPFAGSNFSNANRISVGCKSPLTGGIKEANAGGTFGLGLGQLHLAGLTLQGVSDDWVVIHIAKTGEVRFDSAADYMDLGNFQAADRLHQHYGKKTSIALCGPVGEYQGLVAGIAFSDSDRRPSRLAARGGVGAVMGSKKVKAIVLELHKMPTFHDRKRLMGAIKRYGDMLAQAGPIENYTKLGTAFVADMANHIGGLPVRNFSSGRLVDTEQERLKLGGEYIREQNLERGGDQSHACMPGCLIKCSNVYVDPEGQEVVSPIEYETIGLLGSNCGLTEPDELAKLNLVANDLGVDTIEVGAMFAVLMEAGRADFGDAEFMHNMLKEIRQGSELGRQLAQGTARVARHLSVARAPVIKRQAISAYDPRVMEVTGITMMVTAQGADHTAGNLPFYDCRGKELEELVQASLGAQVAAAAADSLGLCIFGRAVTDTNADLIVSAINDALGTDLDETFYQTLGRETLRLEREFNLAAGFDTKDDELPSFFYHEALAPTDNIARFHARELREGIDAWWASLE